MDRRFDNSEIFGNWFFFVFFDKKTSVLPALDHHVEQENQLRTLINCALVIDYAFCKVFCFTEVALDCWLVAVQYM